MSDEDVHVAMFPSAGMGHLTPFLRLVVLLLNNHCKVTVITPLPTVSLAEAQLLSRFQSSFPQLNLLPFHLHPPPPSSSSSSSSSSPPSTADPFFLRLKTLRDSAHLLSPLISSLSPPPLSAFVSDGFLISPLIPVTRSFSLPNYILVPSSAAMFSFVSLLPTVSQSLSSSTPEGYHDGSEIPFSSIPPILLQPNTIFRNLIMEDTPNLTNLDGVFINTFEPLESHSLEALNAGKVVKGLPPVYAIGPFMPFAFEKESQSQTEAMKWLDDKAIGSVVYV